MGLENLFDVPGFSSVRNVTAGFKVDLTIHGGFVRRIALAIRDERRLEDPEELAFFSSDIDVMHTGPAGITNDIHLALIASVPFGESIRWQVRSLEESAEFIAAMPMNGIVPANLLTLSSSGAWGIKDEWSGRDDIDRRTYRYIRNGFYKRSPLYRAGRDLEIFSALLYIKTVLDDPRAEAMDEQPGCGVVKTVIHSACSTPAMLTSLQESAYLRARLLYLVKDICTLKPDPNSRARVFSTFDLDHLVEYLHSEEMFRLGHQMTTLKEASTPIAVSARLGGDQYRLDLTTESWFNYTDDSLNCNSEILISGKSVFPELPAGHVTVSSSPEIKLNRGTSTSSRSGDVVNEFLHFAVPFSTREFHELSRFSGDDLACLLELSSAPPNEDAAEAAPAPDRKSLLIPIPSVCSMKRGPEGGLLYVRMNAFGFLENAGTLLSAPADHTITAEVTVVARNSPDISASAHTQDETASQPTDAPFAQSIVFVHGILSNASACFAEMSAAFRLDPRFADARLLLFDYDYNNPMERSARDLELFLEALPEGQPITLICHSMGGLVARLMILRGQVKVHRLIMLCTPNFGALRTAQLGLASQLMMYTFGKIYGLFRKPGIRDLTRVTDVFKDALASGSQFADEVEYVTIPGEFFNESRTFWDRGSASVNKKLMSVFGGLSAVSALSAITPLWSLGLQKPHDGIVEAVSNSLIPCIAGRQSEKCPAINQPERFGATYWHITHRRCSDLTHVAAQHDAVIIALVRDIAASSSVSEWRRSLSREELRPLTCLSGAS